MNNRQPSEIGDGPYMGFLGAGRVGDAMAALWMARTNRKAVIWSRSGQNPPQSKATRIPSGSWVADWSQVLAAKSVVAAIPGSSLMELACDSDSVHSFQGRLYSSPVSLSQDSLRLAFPNATVVRIAPFLIDEINSIPMLVLRPSQVTDTEWAEIAAELRTFGDIDVVEDESVYERLTLMGSPWPSVISAVINYAANMGGQGQDNKDAALGRHLFLRAMRSLIFKPSNTEERMLGTPDIIATPGGITERGMQHVKEFNNLVEHVFKQMQLRADELRADTLKTTHPRKSV